MTEEDKLKQAPGCGTAIMLGLIVIVILSLIGVIFPGDILPYPREMMIGILVIAVIALVIAVFMWRGKVKDRKQAEDDKADALLQKGFETWGDTDDEASRLAELYKDDDEQKK